MIIFTIRERKERQGILCDLLLYIILTRESERAREREREGKRTYILRIKIVHYNNYDHIL